MRIIGGQLRGKRLFSPKDKSVRPTTDRIKETIFNILTSKGAIDGANVLDLFCGSGALGIEALSRGAKNSVFIDGSLDSVKLTRLNLKTAGLNAEVFHTGFDVAIKKLEGNKFDIIFMDPPYFDNIASRCLFLIEKYDILSQDGIIVYEYSSKNGLSTEAEKFIIDTRNFGSVSVSFLSKLEVTA